MGLGMFVKERVATGKAILFISIIFLLFVVVRDDFVKYLKL
jgi:hypothetical protein